ncbi:hypothetical protein EXIGLDRAFT_474361 [Exidia glandulosa HHB12029]|uniref:Uncharacterized protein n=1 Tax=Exidia glandulosa HHB12029 TaxID=1314781 RepID=A0A166NLR0_EXIGL|nr:hypothetical protein EXIGLDRAFT_474361 [Exidia glandulosa HHB12029]
MGRHSRAIQRLPATALGLPRRLEALLEPTTPATPNLLIRTRLAAPRSVDLPLALQLSLLPFSSVFLHNDLFTTWTFISRCADSTSCQ